MREYNAEEMGAIIDFFKEALEDFDEFATSACNLTAVAIMVEPTVVANQALMTTLLAAADAHDIPLVIHVSDGTPKFRALLDEDEMASDDMPDLLLELAGRMVDALEKVRERF